MKVLTTAEQDQLKRPYLKYTMITYLSFKKNIPN